MDAGVDIGGPEIPLDSVVEVTKVLTPKAKKARRPPDLENHNCSSDTTTFLLDGHHYGNPEQFNLKGNQGVTAPSAMLECTFYEPNLRKDLSVKLTALRAPHNKKAPMENQFNSPKYEARITLPCRRITKLEYIACDKMKEDIAGLPKDFNGEGKAFLVVEADQCITENATVPRLRDPGCEKKMNDLFHEIRDRKRGGKKFRFVFIIRTKADLQSKIFEKIKYSFHQEQITDPMLLYIKDSPTLLHIRIGNIHPPASRPALSTAFKVCRKRLIYQDRLEHKVFNTYAVTEDYEWQKGMANVYIDDNFSTVFTPIPASAFKDPTRPMDNDLPKQYKVFVEWSNKKENCPKAGDKFAMRLEKFPVPDVPPYSGPYVKMSSETDITDNDYEEGLFGEIVHAGPTMEGKRVPREEEREKHIQRLRQTWSMTASPPDATCPSTHVAFMAHRPFDCAWMGPDEEKPRVGTLIPEIPSAFYSIPLFRKSIASSQHHQIKLNPVFSDKQYKDLMNCLHEFHEKSSDPGLIAKCIPEHLAQLLTDMDMESYFPEVNLFDHAPKDSDKFLSILSPLQREAFTSHMSHIEHGIAAIHGCVASAKTMFGVLVMLMAIAKPTKAGDRKRGLWVSETNEAVNDAARKLYDQCKRLDLPLKIIRIHSFESESQRFQDKLNPRDHPPHFHASQERLDKFKYPVERLLNDYGEKAEAERKRGDPRRSAVISNLSLSEAMWEELRDGDDVEYVKLRSALKEMHMDPHSIENSQKEVNRLISVLMGNTRSKADVEVTTCACSIQTKFREDQQYAVISFDEAAKSVPYYFYALVGAYSPSLFFMVIGDIRQGLPYNVSAMGLEDKNINCRFKTSIYSILHRLKDAGFPICSLWETYRSFTATLHQFISDHNYNGLMIDGALNLEKPAEVQFGREFIEGKFGVKDNWVVVNVKGSTSSVEDNGTSIRNTAHEILVMEYIHDLIKALRETKLDFDKTRFTTKLISPYTAQVNRIRNRLVSLRDPRFASLSGKVAQGVEGHCVILHTPNAMRWTTFVNDNRDLLVELTRHRYVLIVIISENCLLPDSYGLSTKYAMYNSNKAKNLLAFVDYAEKRGNLVSANAPNTMACHVCEEIGHKASECPQNQECWNSA